MVAEALDLPVVLVVDAKTGIEGVAATVLGLEKCDIEVAGIIAQRNCGRHADGIHDDAFN